jgi:hypothetical protein
MEHEFTLRIRQILTEHFGETAFELYEQSPLLQYVNIKTRSANRGAKARGSYANLYAIYVLIEDYLKQGFEQREGYSDYEGARFSDLFRRQRELPFGNKLQNHALNSRMNEEFKRYFPNVGYIPILRDLQTSRYWINENLLRIRVGKDIHNIAAAIIAIINVYVETKLGAFERFIETTERLKDVTTEEDVTVEKFVFGLLAPQVDARIFEIVSYAILKFYYHDQIVYFGLDMENVRAENLKLYKTGRTNANDGGIDFVMRPLGRFFQVTETIDVRKYFLDIDKVERYPISFVIKSENSIDDLKQMIHRGAQRLYAINAIVDRYMNCIEEIINLPTLRQRLIEATAQGYLRDILAEIIRQSKVEFNYDTL